MTEYAHIHPNFRHIMLLSDKERIEFLHQPRWIGYKAAEQVITTLSELMNAPKRPRMQNLLLVGESNNGKTTVIRQFCELYSHKCEDVDAEPFTPIILAESPPTADEKGLYISILERFFTPYRATDTASKLRYQIIHLCRACHVQMLIIDEFHSLLAGTPIKQRELMNAIKLLCNELMIPIVGVGTRDAVRVLHSDPQHASRFDVMTLSPWKLDTEFRRLLVSFEQCLPLKKPSQLDKSESAKLLHSISEGNFGNLHRLLVECAVTAINSGSESIDEKLIDQKSWLRPTRGIRELIG
jgi:hypothetical protein